MSMSMLDNKKDICYVCKKIIEDRNGAFYQWNKSFCTLVCIRVQRKIVKHEKMKDDELVTKSKKNTHVSYSRL